MTALRLLPVGTGPDVLAVLGPLEQALGGHGEALLPYAVSAPLPVLPGTARIAGSEGRRSGGRDALPSGLALAVATSGSTGPVKHALLTGDNLIASASSTHAVLGGPGAWLLALPAHHVAGLQVLVRSLLAGITPTVIDVEPPFSASGFIASVDSLPRDAPRRYTALVPTQLGRLLEDPAGRDSLRGFDAVLVGGAATGADLTRAARAHGIRLVRTYGMSETAGGCVYEGVPLPVSDARIDPDQRVVLGGRTVAHGYLGEPDLTAERFHTDRDGRRWFRTDDLGWLDEAGLLHVWGRADDVITTGGLKVAPGPVESALARHLSAVRDAVVVGAADPTWGEAVCAAVTLRPGAAEPTVRDVRSQLRGILPDHALPRRLLVLDEIPLTGPGKPDRAALRAAFEAGRSETMAVNTRRE